MNITELLSRMLLNTPALHHCASGAVASSPSAAAPATVVGGETAATAQH